MDINLIEAIDNAKIDSDIAVAESMIMCYDKQLLLMEYESTVDIFQEGKIMNDVKEQGKGQTKTQKILTFIPRLLNAIFKALTGKLSKAGGSAKKVAEVSKKIPAEINKKIANAFNKGDKKALKTALVASIVALGAGGVAIGSKAIAKKLKPEWFKKKENDIKKKTDELSSKKPNSGLVKIGKKWTSLFEKFSKQGGLPNIDIEKEADNIIKDIDGFIGYDYDNDLIDEEKDLVKELNEIAKELSCSENTEKPKNTETPAEQKADTQEASNDKDPEDVDAFVNRVLTDEIKGLIDSGLFKIDLDASYAYSISFRMCLPHSFILELSGYVHTITEVSEMKKLFDDLKNLVNTNNPSILKNIAKRIHLDLNSCDVFVNKQTDDVKRVIDKYHTISPEELSKKFSYIEDEKDREKLINDYEIIVKGLQKLSTKYLLIVNNVIDEFYKYFSNIDKDGVSSYSGSRTMSIDSMDVLKQAEMVDSSIKGAMSKS